MLMIIIIIKVTIIIIIISNHNINSKYNNDKIKLMYFFAKHVSVNN